MHTGTRSDASPSFRSMRSSLGRGLCRLVQWHDPNVPVVGLPFGLALRLVGELEPFLGHAQHHLPVMSAGGLLGKLDALLGVFAELGWRTHCPTPAGRRSRRDYC